MGSFPTFPCLAAARNLDPGRFRRFRVTGRAVGWIRADLAEHLRDWPGLFRFDEHGVTLSDLLAEERERTAALGGVVERLAAEAVITGWRDERFAIGEGLDAPPLAFIERAAARFFGIATYAAHLNGVVHADDGWRMWIARRSAAKPIDPGMLDNLVGGGIASGFSPRQTVIKEGWEEAGIPAALMASATPGRQIQVLREVAEGCQWERIFVHDLELPADFEPVNHDGEVAEFYLSPLPGVIGRVAAEQLTLDASLVALDFLYRGRHVREPGTPEHREVFGPSSH